MTTILSVLLRLEMVLQAKLGERLAGVCEGIEWGFLLATFARESLTTLDIRQLPFYTEKQYFKFRNKTSKGTGFNEG